MEQFARIYGIALLMLLPLGLKAQSVLIKGKVLSTEEFPLQGATIQSGDSLGTVSDAAGGFSLRLPLDKAGYLLVIRMLGYEKLDTLIRSGQDKIYLEAYLRETAYSQPEVTVTEKAETIFEKTSWSILGLKVFKGRLLVLYIEGGARRLGVYSLGGRPLYGLSLEGRYNALHISCSSRLHLVGRSACLEVVVSDTAAYPLRRYPRAQFDQFIKPCVFKANDRYLFKSYSGHNKHVHYFTYNEDKQPALLYELFDNQAHEAAGSFYRKIIGMYSAAVAHPEEGAIDEGMDRINLIERGEWSGALADLILNNELHTAVSYYENVEAQPIPTAEFRQDGKLLVLDPVKASAVQLSLSGKPNKKQLRLKNWEGNGRFQVLEDDARRQAYLLEEKNKLYRFHLDDKQAELKFTRTLQLQGYFPRGLQVYDGQLLYFSQPEINRPFTAIHRIALD